MRIFRTKVVTLASVCSIVLSINAGCASVSKLSAPATRAASQPATKPTTLPAPEPTATSVLYRPDETDEAVRRKCTLDIYTPPGGQASAVIVWFHGGGMTAGDKGEAKKIVRVLTDNGISLVTANYRLSPTSKYPTWVEDAAAATAWMMNHADRAGTTRDRVFIGGYSAGGFLAMAVGTQPQWLAKHGIDNKTLRGIVGVSPQVFTHYTIRAERGLKAPTTLPFIDDTAPIRFASADLPPVQLFVGDKDTATRREELQYFMSVLRAYKHPDATLTVTPDRTHGTMTNYATVPGDPFGTRLVEFLKTRAVATPATAPRATTFR